MIPRLELISVLLQRFFNLKIYVKTINKSFLTMILLIIRKRCALTGMYDLRVVLSIKILSKPGILKLS